MNLSIPGSGVPSFSLKYGNPNWEKLRLKTVFFLSMFGFNVFFQHEYFGLTTTSFHSINCFPVFRKSTGLSACHNGLSACHNGFLVCCMGLSASCTELSAYCTGLFACRIELLSRCFRLSGLSSACARLL
jgi:hypothetical protein